MTSVQTTTAVYTVKEGDTLIGIGETLEIPPREIAEFNHLANPNHIEIGQRLKLPGHMYKSVVVKPGENLTVISNRLKEHVAPEEKPMLSVNELVRLNHIANRDLIFPDETIVFPNLEGTPDR